LQEADLHQDLALCPSGNWFGGACRITTYPHESTENHFLCPHPLGNWPSRSKRRFSPRRSIRVQNSGRDIGLSARPAILVVSALCRSVAVRAVTAAKIRRPWKNHLHLTRPLLFF
ncbi:MAG: hypothetical protein ONB49_20795, partial [candidate division KSB1 bacterium]|nr:hypothetical protein [candidate division KSB1 bacterium]